MNFIGCITFNGSDAKGRETNAAPFGIIADWYSSVVDYYRQEVITGNYDGYHITVSVINQETNLVIEEICIENPWRN